MQEESKQWLGEAGGLPCVGDRHDRCTEVERRIRRRRRRILREPQQRHHTIDLPGLCHEGVRRAKEGDGALVAALYYVEHREVVRWLSCHVEAIGIPVRPRSKSLGQIELRSLVVIPLNPHEICCLEGLVDLGAEGVIATIGIGKRRHSGGRCGEVEHAPYAPCSIGTVSARGRKRFQEVQLALK